MGSGLLLAVSPLNDNWNSGDTQFQPKNAPRIPGTPGLIPEGILEDKVSPDLHMSLFDGFGDFFFVFFILEIRALGRPRNFT